MKQFFLKLPNSPKTRGVSGAQVFPSKEKSTNIEQLYDFLIYENQSYFNVGEPIPFLFRMGVELEKGAKLTDFLLMGHFNLPEGLLVSKKAYQFLKEFTLIPYELYPVKIHQNDQLLNVDYVWLYFRRLVDCIDFVRTSQSVGDNYRYVDEKSFINLRKRFDQLRGQINQKFPFNNPEKFHAIKALNDARAPKEFILKPDSQCFEEYDLLGFKYDIGWIVSDRLRQQLSESDLTGFVVEEGERRFIAGNG